MYLAGDSVECLLKALVLASTPDARRPDTLPLLMTHAFATLRRMYASLSGGAFPTRVRLDLNLVDTWAPRLRYDPGTIPAATAKRFVAAAERIRAWATERL